MVTTMTQAHETITGPGESVQMSLVEQIEELFSHAEPRLRRLARAQRVAPDIVDDIVQETLLEAWKSLENLRDEARFVAWLDGICRNICLRYQRRQGVLRTHEAPLASGEGQPDDEPALAARLADPASFDPTEELTRQDMAVLLDRALGYLSREHREVVEQHYLAEIPQRELAARLGLSLSALEARLHRARGQMLRLFSRELRNEALAFGLAVGPADSVGWRQTRITCMFCGQARMLGIFEAMADGRVNLRLRCPACPPAEINTVGIVDLATARSFLPAVKKAMHQIGRVFLDALASEGRTRCWICQRPTKLLVVRDASSIAATLGVQTCLESSCGCISTGIFAISPYGVLPEVREFTFGTSAVVILPDVEMTYGGHDALRFGLLSPANGQRLYVFADRQSLLPLAVVVE